jgi:hypothetical protein
MVHDLAFRFFGIIHTYFDATSNNTKILMLKVTKVEKPLSACYGSCSFKTLITKEKYDFLKLLLPDNLHLKTFATRWR